MDLAPNANVVVCETEKWQVSEAEAADVVSTECSSSDHSSDEAHGALRGRSSRATGSTQCLWQRPLPPRRTLYFRMASLSCSTEDLFSSRKVSEDLEAASTVDRKEESTDAEDHDADFEREEDWEDHWADYPEPLGEELRAAFPEPQAAPEAAEERQQQHPELKLSVQEVWDQLSWEDVFAIMGISICCKHRTSTASHPMC